MKILILIFTLCSFSLVSIAGVYQEPSGEQIEETIKTFKYKGKWIHPLMIKEFLPWSSDYHYPLILSLDIGAASGANRYFGDVKIVGKSASFQDPQGETVAYEWKGKLQNGMHVILISQYGSGTLVATDVGVFKLSKREAINFEGKKYPQLLLEVQRIISAGDRSLTTITINKNELDVDVKCIKTCDSKRIKAVF